LLRQELAEGVGIVRFVSDETPEWPSKAEQVRRHGHVVQDARCQQEDTGPTEFVSQGMDRVAVDPFQ